MKRLTWHLDEPTAYWTYKLSLPFSGPARPQYGGETKLKEAVWSCYLLGGAFPPFCFEAGSGFLRSSPENIIRCFREELVMEGLALTLAWGVMARTAKYVYARPKTFIAEALTKCLAEVEADSRAEGAWKILTRDLGWSNVMASKTLHFMARGLGFEENPPVPIDNAVIMNLVWPWFSGAARVRATRLGKELPGAWRDKENSWESYKRYMTAVNCWAHRRDWTTTAVETTLFSSFQE